MKLSSKSIKGAKRIKTSDGVYYLVPETPKEKEYINLAGEMLEQEFQKAILNLGENKFVFATKKEDSFSFEEMEYDEDPIFEIDNFFEGGYNNTIFEEDLGDYSGSMSPIKIFAIGLGVFMLVAVLFVLLTYEEPPIKASSGGKDTPIPPLTEKERDSISVMLTHQTIAKLSETLANIEKDSFVSVLAIAKSNVKDGEAMSISYIQDFPYPFVGTQKKGDFWEKPGSERLTATRSELGKSQALTFRPYDVCVKRILELGFMTLERQAEKAVFTKDAVDAKVALGDFAQINDCRYKLEGFSVDGSSLASTRITLCKE